MKPHPSILIVDDDQAFADMFGGALRQSGYHVEWCRRGREALKWLTFKTYNLLVVDGLLPDMNGVELIKRIRVRELDTKIVFISAFWKDIGTFNQLTKHLSVSRVLHKPFAPTEFILQIEQTLGPHRPEAETAEDEFMAASVDHTYHQASRLTLQRKQTLLEQNYATMLQQKLADINDAVRRFRQGAGGRNLLEAVLIHTHNLRGSAPIYGYDRVGAAAGRIEDLLQRLLLGQQTSRRQIFRELLGPLRELNATIAHEKKPEHPPLRS